MRQSLGNAEAVNAAQFRSAMRQRSGICGLSRRRLAAETDDVAVRVFNVEVLSSPLRRRQRFDDPGAVRDALFIEHFDAVYARRSVEVLIVSPVLALGGVFGRFLQVQL